MKKVIAVVMTILLTLTVGTVTLPNAKVSAADNDVNNGDWNATRATLYNTEEADMMVRVGRINNFGYGWKGVNPFSGNETGSHNYPFYPSYDDPEGINRIMINSGYLSEGYQNYDGSGNGVNDGYVTHTRYNNYYNGTHTDKNTGERISNKAVSAVALNYDMNSAKTSVSTSSKDWKATSAVLQVFIDDIQPDKHVQTADGRWYDKGAGGFSLSSYNKYKVTLNGVEVPEFEQVINNLDEHGPIGELVTLNVPSRLMDQIKNGSIKLKIDDEREWVTNIYGQTVRNTGDGYAINFVKLLVNPKGAKYNGTVRGKVYEATCDKSGNLTKTGNAIAGAKINVNGVDTGIITGSDGSYTVTNVPAGQVVITATKDSVSTTDSSTGTTTTYTYTPGTYTVGSLVGGTTAYNCDIYLIKTESKTTIPTPPPAPAAREER